MGQFHPVFGLSISSTTHLGLWNMESTKYLEHVYLKLNKVQSNSQNAQILLKALRPHVTICHEFQSTICPQTLFEL